jgi:hypothetical protein
VAEVAVKTESVRASQETRWLLLIHQLPAKPAYVRVKIWRRLHAIGAVPVKNAVHALPASEHSQEDFGWLLKEIVEGGGEAIICEARLIDGLSDADIREMFNTARDAEFGDIATEARALSVRVAQTPLTEPRGEVRAQFSRLKSRYAQTVGIDFFDANGREAADGLLRGLEQSLSEREIDPAVISGAEKPVRKVLKDRVWVTRIGVHVDRIACAWLVKRFIDDRASFKFVPPKGYLPESNELRFDMFDAEFTHEGDRCSFEVLLERAGLHDPALTAIAQIVHDIDLKDDKYGREEAPGIKTLINGICADTRDDDERLMRGAAMFDDLYAVFSRKRGTRTERKTES